MGGGDLHFNKGQEHLGGACAALRRTDYIVTHHRTIAHSIAREFPLAPLVAELLERHRINKEWAARCHIRYRSCGICSASSWSGRAIGRRGVAWAVKYHSGG